MFSTCSLLSLRHPNLFLFTSHCVTLRYITLHFSTSVRQLFDCIIFMFIFIISLTPAVLHKQTMMITLMQFYQVKLTLLLSDGLYLAYT